MSEKKVRVASLFSGIGAFEQGLFRALGEGKVEVVFSSEIDKYAAKSYEIIYGEKPHGDITKIDEKTQIPPHDILTAGIPCQPFSISGKRLGFSDTRGTLFYDVARVVKHHTPQYVIIENVKGFVNHDKGNTISTVISVLEDIGYNVKYTVLNSKNFNVPQNRERVFILGKFNDPNWDFEFPTGGEVSMAIKDILEENVAEKFYLKQEQVDKYVQKDKPPTTDIKKVGYIDNPHKDKDNLAVVSTEGICPALTVSNSDERKIIIEGTLEINGWQDHMKRVYSDEGLSPTISTFQGGNTHPKIIEILEENPSEEFTLSEHAKNKILDKLGDRDGKLYNYYNDRVYQADEPIGTITTQCGSWTTSAGFIVLDNKPYSIRKLTPRECFRLQGFEDRIFDLLQKNKLSNTQLYKQAGNSITINVVEAIFKDLFKDFFEEE